MPDEDLRRLDGRSLDGFILTVRNKHRPRGREYECRYFELYLKDPDGALSVDPIIHGLYSSGRPSISLRSYFDITFGYKPRFDTGQEGSTIIDLSENGTDLSVFNALSELVDFGGKIIVSLSAPERLRLINDTFTHLNLGLPPEATYLGSLLYRCGCGVHFKSWLIREGGREGPPALQGEKAYSLEDEMSGVKETAVRLMKFLDESAGGPTAYQAPRERALSILRGIRVEDTALQRMIDGAVKRPASRPASGLRQAG